MQEIEQEISRDLVIVIGGVARLTPRAFMSAIRLACGAAKLGAKTIGAIGSIPNTIIQNRKANQHGKMSVKALTRQGKGLQSVEVSKDTIGDFNRIAKKYGIDFAPYKVKGERTFMVFFKAPDTDAMTAAFKEYTAKEARKASRPSLRQRLEKTKSALKKPTPERATRPVPTR